MALLVWQLAAIDRQGFTNSATSACIRLTALSELLLWSAIGAKSDPFDSSLRFQQFDLWKERSPFVAIAYFCWDAFPLALYTWLFGYLTPVALVLGAGIASAVLFPVWKMHRKTGRFPAPRFKPAQVNALGVNMFLLVLALYQLWIDLPPLLTLGKALRPVELQVVLLLFGAYWTTQFLLKRHATETSTGWPRQLERHLLLGSVTTRQVISQIEHRVFGPRLSTVIAAFWIELSEAQDRATRAVEELEKAAQDKSKISAAQLGDGLESLPRKATESLREVEQLHSELLAFISKTISRQKSLMNRDPRVIAAIGAVQREHRTATERTSQLVDRVVTAKSALLASE